MPTGILAINYKNPQAIAELQAAENAYKQRGNAFNEVNRLIAKAQESGANFECLQNAREECILNWKLCKQKSEALHRFINKLSAFYQDADHADKDVAELFGWQEKVSIQSTVTWGDAGELVVDMLSEKELLPPGAKSLLTYLVKGEFDSESTIKYSVKGLAEVFKDVPELGSPLKALGNAASALYSNLEQFEKGEISFDRMFVESASEAYVDIMFEAAVGIMFGPVGFLAAPAATWVVDEAFELFTGKDLSENIGDAAGLLYDGGKMVVGAVADGIGDFANAVGDGIGKAVNTISDLTYVLSNSVAGWWPW